MTSSAGVDARDQGWRREIEALEEQNRAAFLGQDIETLRRLWSEDLVVNSPLNRVSECHQVLDLLQKGVIRHYLYEVQIETMRRRADIVVVMGRDVVTNAPDGPSVPRRFTNVWQAVDGTWRMIARHAHALS